MPRFFNQKIAANEPEKNIPSTAAKATTRSAYVAFLSAIHLSAQSAFFLTHGIVSIALNRYSLREEEKEHSSQTQQGKHCCLKDKTLKMHFILMRNDQK